MPIFCICSTITIDRFVRNLKKSNIIIGVIFVGIITSSIIFYDFQKIDYEHEKESFEISYKISSMIQGVNKIYPEHAFLITSETIQQWPIQYNKMEFNIQLFPTVNNNTLEQFIEEFHENGLTHIIADDRNQIDPFLKDVFMNENKEYLEKVYDSKQDGFEYHVKLFKINYEKFFELIPRE